MNHFDELQKDIYNDCYFNGESHKNNKFGLVPIHWSLTNNRWIETASSVAPLLHGKVIEVGCGRGTLVHHLCNSHGLDVVGLDIAQCMIDKPISDGISGRLFQGSLHDMHFDDGTFGSLIMFDVLEHIPFDYLTSTINGISRVCTKNATVMGTLPIVNYMDIKYSYEGKFEHYLSATEDWWVSTLSGFLDGLRFIKSEKFPFNMSPDNTFFIGTINKEEK